jgi:hypothetical protein
VRRGVGLLLALTVVAGACSGGGSDSVRAKGNVRLTERLESGVVDDVKVAFVGRGTKRCAGSADLDDMTGGAPVLLRDADGKIVGKAELAEGVTTFKDDSTGKTTIGVPQHTDDDAGFSSGVIACTLAFNVGKVDGGSDFYTVEVAGRRPVTVKRSELPRLALAPR